jgi:hypothetical protein
LTLVATCGAASLAVGLPGLAALLGLVAGVLAFTVVRSRFGSNWSACVAGSSVFVLMLAAVRYFSENGSLAAFVLVLLIALVSVRIGRAVGARATRTAGGDSFFALIGLLAPVVLLLPLAVLDMGLFLVMAIPIGVATLLAAGREVLKGVRVLLPLGVALLLGYVVISKVLFPGVESIRRAPTHAAKAEAFDAMGRLFGLRIWKMGAPLDRAAARGVATRDQALAERLLVSAAPGEARDLLMPSIEQIWGAKAYSRAESGARLSVIAASRLPSPTPRTPSLCTSSPSTACWVDCSC